MHWYISDLPGEVVRAQGKSPTQKRHIDSGLEISANILIRSGESQKNVKISLRCATMLHC